MTDPEIEYRGYVVRFSENQDVWRCWALDLEGEKLSTVKAKIDRIIAQSRKLSEAVPMMYMDHFHTAKPVRVVALAQPRKGEDSPTDAWCLVPGRERFLNHDTKTYDYRDVEERKKLPLLSLYLDTPENRAAVAEIDRLKAERMQIDRRIKDTLAEMPAAVGHFHVEVEEDDAP